MGRKRINPERPLTNLECVRRYLSNDEKREKKNAYMKAYYIKNSERLKEMNRLNQKVIYDKKKNEQLEKN